ncbi:MAG: glycosyltransferase [Eubacterium sp.]|nr:glycosyltransferase [Eubacterium sp.]
MIKYSIIIPVYQCEKYLESCVHSVLNQLNTDFEILLIDDGSSDGSAELADELASQNERIRVFHQQNSGAASARNRGIKESRGKYLLFFDADDSIEDKLFKNIDEIINEKERELIVFGVNFDYYRNDCMERSEVLSCAHKGEYSVEQVMKEFENFFWDNSLSGTWNKVFSRKIIRENNLQFQEGMIIYEDLNFVLSYLQHIKEIFFINQSFYHYRNELDNNRFSDRVSDLIRLRENNSHLLFTQLKLGEQYKNENKQFLKVSENLYLTFLRQNIMVNHYSVSEMKVLLPEYCSENQFKQLMQQGNELTDDNKKILGQIRQGDFNKLYWVFKKRKIISGTKKKIKKIINMTGMKKFR